MRGPWALGLALAALASAVTAGSLRVKRSESGCPNKWDISKPIKYTMDARFSSKEQKLIKKAMEGIVEHTCIHLVHSEADPPATEQSLAFQKIDSGHCRSVIGRSADDGPQTIKLKMTGGDGCQTLGGVQHEAFHAFGLMHEMQRPDRDTYITVLKDNILPAAQGQFNKANEATIMECEFWGGSKGNTEPTTYQTMMGPLDFASTMMYSTKFASNGKGPTYETKHKEGDGTKSYLVSPSHKTYAKMSFGDKKRINRAYGCTDGCESHECAQQGFAAKDQDDKCRCICSNEDLDPAPRGGDPGCTHAKADKRRKRNIEYPTCEGKITAFDKDFQGVISSVPLSSSPGDSNIRDHEVECFNVRENSDKGKNLLHVSFFGTAYVDEGAGENSLSVTDNSMADAPLKWKGSGAIDTTKMAFVMEGSAWIELSVQNTNAYGVAFNASITRIDYQSFLDAGNCLPSPGEPFVCYNGGALKVEGGKCACECRDQWTGQRCEKWASSDCAKVWPCQNGGRLNLDTCACECPPSIGDGEWIGASCQHFDKCFKHLAPTNPARGMLGNMGQTEITDADGCDEECPYRNVLTLMRCPISCSTPCECSNGMVEMAPEAQKAAVAGVCDTQTAAGGQMPCPEEGKMTPQSAMAGIMCGQTCGLCTKD